MPNAENIGKIKWAEGESNPRHQDFQTYAVASTQHDGTSGTAAGRSSGDFGLVLFHCLGKEPNERGQIIRLKTARHAIDFQPAARNEDNVQETMATVKQSEALVLNANALRIEVWFSHHERLSTSSREGNKTPAAAAAGGRRRNRRRPGRGLRTG